LKANYLLKKKKVKHLNSEIEKVKSKAAAAATEQKELFDADIDELLSHVEELEKEKEANAQQTNSSSGVDEKKNITIFLLMFKKTK